MAQEEREQIGDCALYRGDCREILPTLGAVNTVVTDPPYGILSPGDYPARRRDDRGGQHGLAKAGYAGYADTYENFCTCIVPALTQSIQLAHRAAVFTGPHLQEQLKATAIGGIYIPAGSGRHEWGFKTFLPVLFYGIAPNLHQGARPNTLLSTATVEPSLHPCPKPLPWMRWLVGLASLPSETVLDPFMGSGTTGMACIQLGRSFIGIEIERRYFDLACKRLEETLRQGDLFLGAPRLRPQQLVFMGDR
jgi:site-specific DNA-methyltransferase (adenine-specific)